MLVTATGIYLAKSRKSYVNNKGEVELPEPKFELGDFLISCKIEHKEIEMLEQIGVGGEATVYKAKWADKEVAYKIFNVINQDAITGFEEEARVMLKSNHPNVIRLYGVCLKQNTFGLLMEYMEMGSLKQVLKQKTRYRFSD